MANNDVNGLIVRDLAVDAVSQAGAIPILKKVSVAVPPQTIVGLVGETGSGKSMTARAILGTTPPGIAVKGGEIVFNGAALPGPRNSVINGLRGAHIAFIPQNPRAALHPTLNIQRQFQKLVGRRLGLSKKQLNATAEEALASCGISQAGRVLASHAHELSGGMAQRVVIAMAMALKPEMLIADEPTTGLDVTVQRQVLDLLSSRVREQGSSMLLITHDLGVVARYCDEVSVMYRGLTVEQGAASTLLDRPAHPYTTLLAQAARRPMDQPQRAAALNSPLEDGVGCPFVGRCPERVERCVSEEPVLRLIANERTVACHRAEEVLNV